eukprot:TRINITY_DN4644_c0_g1_i1.p1 TRINITY_DN4644_c0_g1~~TRINITY_DN4644_c0_g1_i1.p1  ORF type:complete len:128 (+),score=27.57 TRINITY_DN4644_c0_g1_i1:67-450(+)
MCIRDSINAEYMGQNEQRLNSGSSQKNNVFSQTADRNLLRSGSSSHHSGISHKNDATKNEPTAANKNMSQTGFPKPASNQNSQKAQSRGGSGVISRGGIGLYDQPVTGVNAGRPLTTAQKFDSFISK